MDWDGFRTAWHDTGCRTLADLAATHPGERLYAAAFHLFYGDGTQVLPPALAANAESAVRVDDGCSTRYAPPEWRWDTLDAASEAMRPWYHRLTEELLARATTGAEQDAAAAALEAAHDRAMAGVCRAMTTTARRGGIHDSLPADFVVVVLEGQRGDGEAALIRESVDAHVLPTVVGLRDHLRDLERT